MNVGNQLGQLSAADALNQSKSQPADAAQAATATPAQTPQPQAIQPQTIQDQVQFSSASGLVAAAMRSSDVRMTKVDQLQTAIGAGTYNVSSSAVADKVIGSLLR